LEVNLANIGKAAYPKLYVNFTVTITPAVCDCTMLTWDKPVAQPLSTTVLVEPSPTLTIVHALANAASKLAHPAIRMCY
jgi:predicted secreted Zn-dependent protease